MITFKQKQYVIPEEERFVKPEPFRIPNEWSIYGIKIDVKEAGSYTNEVKQRKDSIWTEWRKDLKRIRKEISDGYIYKDKYSNSSDTHYYPSESEFGKRYYTSKSINGGDRLMYDIYAPELITSSEMNKSIVVIKVILRYCIGHTHRNGRKFSKQE